MQYQVEAGSASTADFGTPSPRPLVFIGNSSPISVPVVTDDVAEGDETFSVRLTQARDDNGPVELGTTTGTATITENDELTAEVSSQDTTVLEGESATFVVRLENAANQLSTSSASVEIDYTVAGATVSGLATDVAENEDFSPEKGRLTIPAGRSTGTIQIEAVDDDILEPNEGLQVTLSNPSPSNIVTGVGDPAQTVIGASDSPARVSVADVTVDEGETAMIEVKLSKEVSSQVSVTYSLDPQPDTDYSNPTPVSPLVFAPGETAKTIEVKTTQDTLAEDEETFTVTLTLPDPPTGVSPGRSVARVTITDDALRATIEGDASVDEGEAAVYTVTVTGGTFGTGDDDEVTVTWSTEESSATPNDDFTPASGTLVLDAEEPTATFTISTVDDDIAELGEIIEVSLTAQTVVDGETEPVRTGSPARTMIVDDDGAVEVSIIADQTVVAEGQPTTFTVELTGAVAEALTLRYTTVDGTATAGTDYTAAGGEAAVEIAAGEMSTTITVPTEPDDQDEIPDEIFSVRLLDDGLPEDVAIETPTASVRITDHEISARVDSDQETVNEGSAVVFTVSLTVDGNAAGAQNRTGVEVDYAIGGNVTAADYREASTGTVTFLPDEDEATITITTRDDDGLDRGETLTLSLTDATSLQNQGLAVVHPTAGAASTMISDGGSVTWSVADISVGEDEPAIFTVTLNALVQDDVTLTYSTRDGTAKAGSDYTAVRNATVTVTGDSRRATFTVATQDDRDPESTEAFTVELELMNPPSDGVGPRIGTAEASIIDDDLALEPVLPVTMTEGETRPIELTFDPAPPETVMLRVDASGTATHGVDYVIALQDGTPLQGTFPLMAGTEKVTVLLRALDDSLAEGDEELMAELWTVPPSGPGSMLGTVMVTIEDNDQLSASVTVPETVTEGEVARFTVSLSGGTSTANVVVSYTVGGTAKAPGDYTAPSGSLTIQSGESSGRIPIQTNTDNEIEADETLVVTLTAVQTDNGSARVGSPSSATTAIQDPVFHSLNRVNQTLLPGVVRASAASALEAVSWRMAEAAQGDPPASADLAGLTGLYRALLANERALQDGSYDLAKVLGGSSFLVPLSSHDGDSDSEVGIAVWGGGDFRTIGGGDADTVDWDGSVWSARLGADLRFVDSLLTGIAVSWASGALDYVDATPREDREGTYATWLVSAHPYVGWTTPDFGLWASGGFGFGG